MNTTRNRTTHATFVFFEDARRGFDAFLGQLWHGADQMRPDVRVITEPVNDSETLFGIN